MSEPTSGPGLSPEAARALSAVLDEIVPPSDDGRLPGAGELGLAAAVEAAVRERPDLRTALAAGLAALDELARTRGAAGFAQLPAPARREALEAHAETAPGFLPVLTLLTYAAYYQQPRVLEAIGLEPRPPFPKGYELEPTDWSLLDAVRARPRMYREP